MSETTADRRHPLVIEKYGEAQHAVALLLDTAATTGTTKLAETQQETRLLRTALDAILAAEQVSIKRAELRAVEG